MIRYILFLVFALISNTALSVQNLDAVTEDVIKVIASMSDPNIISITGGAIETVWGADDKVTLEANPDTGQAIFKPLSTTPFTLFVQSAAGNTYTISVTPQKNAIGQLINLDELQLNDKTFDRSLNIISYKKEVKRLLKLIELNKGVAKLPGFRVKTFNKTIPLWSETSVLHAFSWVSGNMVIDKYLVTNTTADSLTIEEREFKNLSNIIRAISLKKHTLEPAETTVLYTFRSPS